MCGAKIFLYDSRVFRLVFERASSGNFLLLDYREKSCPNHRRRSWIPLDTVIDDSGVFGNQMLLFAPVPEYSPFAKLNLTQFHILRTSLKLT